MGEKGASVGVTKYGRREGFGDTCRSSLSHLQPSHRPIKNVLFFWIEGLHILTTSSLRSWTKNVQLSLACYYSWAQAGG